MKNIKNLKKISILLFLLAIIYTILVKYVDVQPIGPKGSVVGFATLNHTFQKIVGENTTWYKITKYLGILPFFYVLSYGLIGLKQLIEYKKIDKIDKKIIALGCFYIIVGIVYILFEKVVINYRPVLEDGLLEASYPSSHTLLAVCVCLSAIFMNHYYIKDIFLRKGLNIGTLLLMLILIIGRALSGVHWISDIIGGIIISLFLVSSFYTICKKIIS